MTDTKRSTIPAAEELIGVKIPCLDKGFLTLVDYMGGDKDIVEAARLSVAGEGVRKVSEDRALIRYLVRMKHTSPLEQVKIKVHQKLPIFVARQQVRHRTAQLNEMSGRYSELPAEFYVPDLDHVQYQDKKNKQGRAATVEPEIAQRIIDILQYDATMAFEQYREYLGKRGSDSSLTDENVATLKEGGGLARELARINLPLSTYTEWYWCIDLHNLLHFLGLRLDPHAQYEIRVYAEALWKIAKAVAPMACEAFEDFRLEAVTFSRHEKLALREMFARVATPGNYMLHESTKAEAVNAVDWPTKREREEFEAKIVKLVQL